MLIPCADTIASGSFIVRPHGFHINTGPTSNNQDSVVGIATGYGQDNRGVGVRVRYGQEFSLLHFVQTDSGALTASYPMCTGGSFPGGKAAGT
jgi:hypothetical protein